MAKQNPLRKITGWWWHPKPKKCFTMKLECGHTVNHARLGARTARCKACGRK